MPETLTLSDATIRYWTAGDPEAPTVVFTHGATLDHAAFASQLDTVRDAGYRVVAWDLRGHGASQPLAGELTLATAADDLAALLDEVGVDAAVHVGQSFGGLVVQEHARRHPDRVVGQVLVGSPALADRAPWAQRVVNRTRPFFLRLWPEAHLRRVLPRFMSQRLEVRDYVAGASRPASKATLVAVTKAALEGLLTGGPPVPVTAPVLVVHGAREQRFVAGLIGAWADRDPGVEVARIDGAGHLANQDDPEAFDAALLGFLRRHAPDHATRGA